MLLTTSASGTTGTPIVLARVEKRSQTLGVGLGDKAALMGGDWQDPGPLQDHHLLRGGGRDVDLQFLTSQTDLFPMEVGEDELENLRQAQSHLPANVEAGDHLAVHHGLLEVGRGRVTSRH